MVSGAIQITGRCYCIFGKISVAGRFKNSFRGLSIPIQTMLHVVLFYTLQLEKGVKGICLTLINKMTI